MASTRVTDEFNTITPQLIVRGVAEAVEFYRTAFGARELYRNKAPDGASIMHCEMLLGNSRFFMHDEFPEPDSASPLSLGGTPVRLHLYVDNVDELFQRAVDSGAEILMPVEDRFWGDRYGMLRDPFGHIWSVATPIEDLSPAQTNRRADEYIAEVMENDPDLKL
jgi:PhnB protein